MFTCSENNTHLSTTEEAIKKPVWECLSHIGSRFSFSFAFFFLRRLWRMGEDTDLCTEVLQVYCYSPSICSFFSLTTLYSV